MSQTLYVRDFLEVDEADQLFGWLTGGVRWERERITLFGRRVVVPRLVSWFGDPGVSYRYSGRAHVARGWPVQLDGIRTKLAANHGLAANFVLANRYLTGADYMGWHSDDEPEMGCRVASVSLGATRRFLTRAPGTNCSTRLDLEHGSLLLFDAALRHSLPRAAAAAERVNLTFRSVGCARKVA
jgi:alkylated DNA repair dioxygenase AlkB